MKTHYAHAVLAATLALSACVASRSVPANIDTASATPAGPAPAVEGRLYARDGTPIVPGPTGAVRVEAEPKRELGEGEGSRASLLELYTNAVAEKNAYAEEVMNLKAALEVERKQVTMGIDERAVLRTEMTKIIRERDALLAESLDLAARLTTAQIARLEAQKELLTMQIDIRMREEAAASVQGSSQSSPKDKRRAATGDH
ncbi:MAG: hypothetical protein JNL28_09115 [Planctomycetes bacterium]|nr:hypothetical protein [Planctomycetota bacterium]